jgi:anti-sigma regulatory factor (Ser/Thr protein kinase)
MAQRQRLTSSGRALRLVGGSLTVAEPDDFATLNDVGEATLELPGERHSVTRGRRWLVRAIAERGVNGMANQVSELLCSELLSNAVLHGPDGDAISLWVRHTEQTLRVAVSDRGKSIPRVLHPGPDSPAGRGMSIVEAMSTRWGIVPGDCGGKTVWFELDLSDF